MGLEEISLMVTICDTCKVPIIVAKEKKLEFTDKEKKTIEEIARQCGKEIRWQCRSIKDWIHCHLE